MTDIQTTWRASNLIYGYFLQDKFWIDADGNVHEIESMHPAYCLNVVCFLERVAPEIYLICNDSVGEAEIEQYATWMTETPLYKKIKDRVRESIK